MAVIFTRKPSEIPNIKNSDDCTLFRYAVGNQDGYIKSKGLECGYSVNGLNFIITSGKLVCQGYDFEIDSNGVSIIIDNIATKRYYSIYFQLNLALQTIEVKSLYDTAGYPTISKGDDLTANTSGTANLEVYRFTATSGVINGVVKVVSEIIDYSVTTKKLEETTKKLEETTKKLEETTTKLEETTTKLEESKAVLLYSTTASYDNPGTVGTSVFFFQGAQRYRFYNVLYTDSTQAYSKTDGSSVFIPYVADLPGELSFTNIITPFLNSGSDMTRAGFVHIRCKIDKIDISSTIGQPLIRAIWGIEPIKIT